MISGKMNSNKHDDVFHEINDGVFRSRSASQSSAMDKRYSLQSDTNSMSTIGPIGRDFVLLNTKNGLNISGETHTLRGQTFSSYRIGPKEDAITFLGIKFDQADYHVYTPNDTISGSVILDVESPTVIRGVEIKILGMGTVQAYSNGYVRHRKTRTFLEKQSMLMGRLAGSTAVIKAGHYTCQFKYKLANDLPSSIFTEGVIKSSIYKIDVSYVVKAMVIDDICIKNEGTAKDRYKIITKPIKIETKEFKVASLSQLDQNQKPVHHEEHLNPRKDKSIQLNMDYTVLQVGKELNVHIDTDELTARSIRNVHAELLQIVVLPDSPFHFRQVISKSESEHCKQSENICTWNLSLLTNRGMVPSYSDETYLATIKYILKVGLRFQNKWMHMEVPVTLRSYGTEEEDLPIFRTVRRGKLSSSQTSPEVINGGQKKPEVNVEVYYNNSTKRKAGSSVFCCVWPVVN